MTPQSQDTFQVHLPSQNLHLTSFSLSLSLSIAHLWSMSSSLLLLLAVGRVKVISLFIESVTLPIFHFKTSVITWNETLSPSLTGFWVSVDRGGGVHSFSEQRPWANRCSWNCPRPGGDRLAFREPWVVSQSLRVPCFLQPRRSSRMGPGPERVNERGKLGLFASLSCSLPP